MKVEDEDDRGGSRDQDDDEQATEASPGGEREYEARSDGEVLQMFE
jgi:hypothetical protein